MSQNQYRYRNYNPKSKPMNRIGKIAEELKKQQKPLSQCFDKKDIYLPDGKAHIIASELRDMNINQLRKIFEMIEKSDSLAKEGKLDAAIESLFMVVPMVAYATGRQLINPTEFNDFVQAAITEQKIKSAEDVKTLYLFMQSIIAYKKTK